MDRQNKLNGLLAVLSIPIMEAIKWYLCDTPLAYELIDTAWSESVEEGLFDNDSKEYYIEIKIEGNNFVMYLQRN